eukprot:TRINITY_DN413_c2_g1_i1.p1 TRINITY_DN413_c2_g1~~TRINITY_DN413_c2_g1_i1.p1  ORF type:complete len:1444 (+),score=363.04 TRINITY_DN413_c2_g1_i1:541-4332(+)
MDTRRTDGVVSMEEGPAAGERNREENEARVAEEALEVTTAGDSRSRQQGQPLQQAVSTADPLRRSVIAALGQQEFWKTRNTMLRQQRLFSSQLFDLHCIVKVQKELLVHCRSRSAEAVTVTVPQVASPEPIPESSASPTAETPSGRLEEPQQQEVPPREDSATGAPSGVKAGEATTPASSAVPMDLAASRPFLHRLPIRKRHAAARLAAAVYRTSAASAGPSMAAISSPTGVTTPVASLQVQESKAPEQAAVQQELQVAAAGSVLETGRGCEVTSSSSPPVETPRGLFTAAVHEAATEPAIVRPVHEEEREREDFMESTEAVEKEQEQEEEQQQERIRSKGNEGRNQKPAQRGVSPTQEPDMAPPELANAWSYPRFTPRGTPPLLPSSLSTSKGGAAVSGNGPSLARKQKQKQQKEQEQQQQQQQLQQQQHEQQQQQQQEQEQLLQHQEQVQQQQQRQQLLQQQQQLLQQQQQLLRPGSERTPPPCPLPPPWTSFAHPEDSLTAAAAAASAYAPYRQQQQTQHLYGQMGQTSRGPEAGMSPFSAAAAASANSQLAVAARYRAAAAYQTSFAGLHQQGHLAPAVDPNAAALHLAGLPLVDMAGGGPGGMANPNMLMMMMMAGQVPPGGAYSAAMGAAPFGAFDWRVPTDPIQSASSGRSSGASVRAAQGQGGYAPSSIAAASETYPLAMGAMSREGPSGPWFPSVYGAAAAATGGRSRMNGLPPSRGAGVAPQGRYWPSQAEDSTPTNPSSHSLTPLGWPPASSLQPPHLSPVAPAVAPSAATPQGRVRRSASLLYMANEPAQHLVAPANASTVDEVVWARGRALGSTAAAGFTSWDAAKTVSQVQGSQRGEASSLLYSPGDLEQVRHIQRMQAGVGADGREALPPLTLPGRGLRLLHRREGEGERAVLDDEQNQREPELREECGISEDGVGVRSQSLAESSVAPTSWTGRRGESNQWGAGPVVGPAAGGAAAPASAPTSARFGVRRSSSSTSKRQGKDKPAALSAGKEALPQYPLDLHTRRASAIGQRRCAEASMSRMSSMETAAETGRRAVDEEEGGENEEIDPASLSNSRDRVMESQVPGWGRGAHRSSRQVTHLQNDWRHVEEEEEAALRACNGETRQEVGEELLGPADSGMRFRGDSASKAQRRPMRGPRALELFPLEPLQQSASDDDGEREGGEGGEVVGERSRDRANAEEADLDGCSQFAVPYGPYNPRQQLGKSRAQQPSSDSAPHVVIKAVPRTASSSPSSTAEILLALRQQRQR